MSLQDDAVESGTTSPRSGKDRCSLSEPEAALCAHLVHVGVTVEELEAAAALIPSGVAAMARTGARPTAVEFRALVASRPSTRPIRMDAHPYADLFPVMTFKDLEALSEDIKRNGQHDAITTFEGKILDGRHRFQACQMADVAPRFEEFTGDDPVAFVISKNLHRRQLKASQRAAIANEMARLPRGNPQLQPNAEISAIGQAQAAELMDVSRDQVTKARRVEREAPELIEPIKHGEMSINAALEKIKPAKPEATTSAAARGTLQEAASSPEAVQKIVEAAAEAVEPRDRLLAVVKIFEALTDRSLRRKCAAFLAKTYCR
jgi:hypothetical protein